MNNNLHFNAAMETREYIVIKSNTLNLLHTFRIYFLLHLVADHDMERLDISPVATI